jgi:hypothetical protein
MERKYANASERQKAYLQRKEIHRQLMMDSKIAELKAQLAQALARIDELEKTILGNASEQILKGRDAIPSVSLFPFVPDSFEGCALSPEMDTDSFRRALTEYLAYRKEKGRTYKKLGLQKLITRMTQLGEKRAIAAIEYSMANGWDGIFEEKENGKPKAGLFDGIKDWLGKHENDQT